jgi:DNA adenine methylase
MNPHELLEKYLEEVRESLANSFVDDPDLAEKVDSVCRCNTNKAPIRFMLACLLAKICRSEIDIRKPYTEIEGDNTFSGRAYDETFIQGFIERHHLPCNATTAFLTPAFRNIDRALTRDMVLVGKPKEVYSFTLELINTVFDSVVEAHSLLKEFLRNLLIIKTENEVRMAQLLAGIEPSKGISALSSEQTITLLEQHLNCKNSSRLPVLIVAAAYLSVGHELGERVLPLQSHNAADKQTGSIGDVEVTLSDENQIVTCYEMKNKRVTSHDVHHALTKITSSNQKIDNYIFITTDLIDAQVLAYAKSVYEDHAIEITILDCLGFIRHFLHFFHRSRVRFLDDYQTLVLNEPNSAVGQPLKEAFLALRRQAESD